MNDPDVMYLSFFDENSGHEFLLVQEGSRSALWDKAELSSSDLMDAVDYWLGKEPTEDYEDEELVESPWGDDEDWPD